MYVLSEWMNCPKCWMKNTFPAHCHVLTFQLDLKPSDDFYYFFCDKCNWNFHVPKGIRQIDSVLSFTAVKRGQREWWGQRRGKEEEGCVAIAPSPSSSSFNAVIHLWRRLAHHTRTLCFCRAGRKVPRVRQLPIRTHALWYNLNLDTIPNTVTVTVTQHWHPKVSCQETFCALLILLQVCQQPRHTNLCHGTPYSCTLLTHTPLQPELFCFLLVCHAAKAKVVYKKLDDTDNFIVVLRPHQQQ